MRTISTRERLRYAFDNTLSRGPMGLVAWLAAVTLILIVIAAATVHVGRLAPGADTGPTSFRELMWSTFNLALFPSPIEAAGGRWNFIAVMFLVSIGGLFVASALIGVISSALDHRLAELRKGRSLVVEREHTVILGWSHQLLTIVEELITANASRQRACIVILGDRDKVEMEDTINSTLGSTGRTRIVCRRGSPMDMADLEITNVDDARAIIVLSPDGSEDPDIDVIKTLLAITNRPGRRSEPYHIVAALRDPRNLEIAEIVGGNEVEVILEGGLIARIIAQTVRQSGLSIVYTDLLDFAGDEIYFHRAPNLAGMTFGDALHRLGNASLIGLGSSDGTARLNPAMDTVITPDHALICIAADDHHFGQTPTGADLVDAGALASVTLTPPRTARILLIGWNWRGRLIIPALDKYAAPGSTLTVVADDAACAETVAGFQGALTNLTAVHESGDPTDRATLERHLGHDFDHVIVVSCSDRLTPERADARTLMTLLHLRDIARKRARPLPVVSEMLDLRNAKLAQSTLAEDFIVSDRIVSLFMAQVAENKALNRVFADLFDPEGAEIYLKPITQYVRLDAKVSYATVVEAARRYDQVAIGYRVAADASAPNKNYGVTLNPRKSDSVMFAAADQLIVLAKS